MTPSGQTKTSSTEMNLTVKNPCVDQNFVSIVGSPLNALQYDINTGPNAYAAHTEFTVNTVPIVHMLCGDLTYSATYKGNPISTSDMPLAYDPATRVFTGDTSDYGLANM